MVSNLVSTAGKEFIKKGNSLLSYPPMRGPVGYTGSDIWDVTHKGVLVLDMKLWSVLPAENCVY